MNEGVDEPEDEDFEATGDQLQATAQAKYTEEFAYQLLIKNMTTRIVHSTLADSMKEE